MDKKHLSVIKRLIGGVILASLFSQAHALGLGKLRVNSALDEPLDAEIQLTSIPAEERETLAVALASRADFRRAGVEFPEFFEDLTVEVADRDGTPVIRIRSQQPAAEPFLHFLVELRWSGGKLIREYTALLDPPVYAAETPTSVSSPRVVEAAPDAPAAPGEMAAGAPAQGEMAAGAPAQGEMAEETVRFGEYGPIRDGETLWSIAAKLQPEAGSVNIFQIMIALLRENPDAFFDNNVNRLKVGQIIKIGDLQAIADISPAEAAVAYQAQLDEWQAYRQQVAGAADIEKTPAAAPMAATEGAAAEAPAAEPPAAEPAAEPVTAEAAADKDVLRIVQATEAPAQEPVAAGAPAPGLAEADAEISRLNDQITTLEESLASRELENQELKERVRMLEEQVKNATRLMEIESQELALAQQQAAERQRAAQEQAAAAAKPQPQPAPKAAEAPAAKPKPQPKPKPRITPAPEKAWWENLLDVAYEHWTWLLGALGVLLAGVGGLMFVRRRRSLAEFEESILSGSALDTQTDTTSEETTGATTDTSFLSDFGMTGVGSVEADEVDPLAEAEVYLAYGRDEQAEEVLKEAAQRHPERPELKLKLLEIYQQREDLKSFETLAEELYPAGGQGEPEVWQKVVAMGRKMNPNNPLFSQGMSAGARGAAAAGAAGAVLAADDDATDFADAAVPVDPGLQPFPPPEEDVALDEELEKLANESETPDPATVLEQENPEPSGSEVEFDSLDFDLDLEEEAANADAQGESNAPDGDDDLLDLNELEDLDEPSTPAVATKAASDAEDDDNLIDLNDLDIELEPTTDSDDEPAGGPAESMPGMDFELADEESGSDGSNDEGGDEDWDEAATKLDLAKAYIDMGDKAGARSIIDEVMREGNQQQRDQAAQLASQLGS